MKKMDNKGFSLVELIIVIAIMAILIGVLAPQYLKYVEKSRVSSDKDQLDSFYTACTTAAADPDLTGIPGNSVGKMNFPGSGTAGTWTAEVVDTMGGTAPKWKSKASGAAGTTAWPQFSTDANGNFTVYLGSSLSISGH
jgi:prepilin-type N-terminal cleavage/methylation domain-containing protein